MNWGETERKWKSESQLNNFWCFHLLHASQEEVFQALWIYGHHIESVCTTELNVTLAKPKSGVTQSLRSHPKPAKSLHLDEIATVTSHCSQYQVGSSSWISSWKALPRRKSRQIIDGFNENFWINWIENAPCMLYKLDIAVCCFGCEIWAIQLSCRVR